MGSYSPRSGVGGQALWTGASGGQINLAMKVWTWHSETRAIRAPAFTGYTGLNNGRATLYVDHAIGPTEGSATLEGVWNDLFNPFSAHVISTGYRGTLELRVNQNGVKSASASAICTSWDISSDADDLCIVQASFVLDYIYNDFANIPA